MTEDTISDKPIQGEIYGRIVRDERISHGAFRLWHLLNDFAGKKGKCWPGQRKLQKLLKCSNDSLKPWTEQLRVAGYLRTEKFSTNQHPTIRINDGTIYFILRGTVPESRSSGTVPETVTELLPKVGTRTVPESRNKTNPIELIQRTKGATPPIFVERLPTIIKEQKEAMRKTKDPATLVILFKRLGEYETQLYGAPITPAPKHHQPTATGAQLPSIADVPADEWAQWMTKLKSSTEPDYSKGF